MSSKGGTRELKFRLDWTRPTTRATIMSKWIGGMAATSGRCSYTSFTACTTPCGRLWCTGTFLNLSNPFPKNKTTISSPHLLTLACRFMGGLTNNSRKLANFAGFYKGIQSAGAAIMWRLDGLDNAPEYMAMFASCWGLLAGSLLFAAPVIWIKILDHADEERDLAFSDERPEEVRGEVGEAGKAGEVGKIGEVDVREEEGEAKGL